jgi:hypothetical protein
MQRNPHILNKGGWIIIFYEFHQEKPFHGTLMVRGELFGAKIAFAFLPFIGHLFGTQATKSRVCWACH